MKWHHKCWKCTVVRSVTPSVISITFSNTERLILRYLDVDGAHLAITHNIVVFQKIKCKSVSNILKSLLFSFLIVKCTPILVSYIAYNISYLREYRTPNSALFGCEWLSLTTISHNIAAVQTIKCMSVVNIVEISFFSPLVVKEVKKIRVQSGV